jgi:hypothetical protein
MSKNRKVGKAIKVIAYLCIGFSQLIYAIAKLLEVIRK